MKKSEALGKLKKKSHYYDDDVLDKIKNDVDRDLEEEISIEKLKMKKSVDSLLLMGFDFEVLENMILSRVNQRFIQ